MDGGEGVETVRRKSDNRTHLFDVRVEGNRHIQQNLALFDTSHKVLDAIFKLVGRLVNFLWVTFSGLSQLLGCLEQLVSIRVGVL